MVHGCLAAGNVLLDDDLEPVLSEAGLVSIPRLSARKGDASLYSPFAAPEVKRGEAAELQSDIWSAGQLLEQLIAENEIPAIVELTRRCSAPVARLRHSSASELLADIDAVLAKLPKDGAAAPGPRRGSAGEPAGRTGTHPTADATRERPSTGRDAKRAPAEPAATRRAPARWPALVGVVVVLLAMSVAFVLGVQTPGLRETLTGLVVLGAALMAWAVAPPPRRARVARVGLVVVLAALAVMVDPIAWALRTGALRRLQGSEIARRAAVMELVDQGRDLRGMKLAGFDLSNLDMSGADLRQADLSHADLSGARLWSAELEGASLEGARLRGADLEETALGQARHVDSAECDRDTRLPEGWHCLDGTLSPK
jgi:hypothetical protein